MARRILFDDDARRALARGVERLAGAVALTLGPAGRNVVIARADGSIAITNDGSTVAREIELPDPFENLGARLVREAAQKTADDVGDGSSTAVVLAHALYRRAAAAVAAGGGATAVKRGLEKGVAAAVEALRAQARPLADEADRAAVAAVAAGGDAVLGRLVADAFARVGKDGTVLVEEGHVVESRLRHAEGVRFERGWVSAYFVTAAEEMRVDLERPLVFLARARLSAAAQVLPAVERAVAERRALLVVAHEIDGEALALLVVNRLRAGFVCCAVPAPGSGDVRDAWLADLAALTGARIVGDEAGLDAAQPPADALGAARRVHVERGATTILEAPGRRAAVIDHVGALRRAEATASGRFERERLAERRARLDGGIAVLEIGAASEVELHERKGRAEDAVAALRAALDEGVVPGGGTALVRSVEHVEREALPNVVGDARAGVRAVLDALVEPARRIAENAGAPGGVIVERIRAGRGSEGFDATLGRVTDLARTGVVDPVRVVRTALQNAASVAGMLLVADALVVDDSGP